MKNKKVILISGGNGLLGGKVAKHLLQMTQFDVLAMARSEDKFKEMVKREGICQLQNLYFISNQDFLMGKAEEFSIYGAIHMAFSRRSRSAAEIAESINFSLLFFSELIRMNIERIINVSSQSVYGNTDKIRRENMPCAPETAYAMAKYATEVLFNASMNNAHIKNYTNLRLDLIAQSQEFLKILCQQAKEGNIKLRGGKQCFSFMDADDAAEALVAMMQSPDGWDRVYNVGRNRKQYTLIEVAESIARVVEQSGYGYPQITLEKQNIQLWSGMDSSHFMYQTGWRTERDIDSIIERIIKG